MKNLIILKITGLTLLLLVLAVIGNYLYDISFKGNANIKIIEKDEKLLSLEELIKRSDFKNNILYIDIWGTSCGPCINEFAYTPALKDRYKDKPVKFIYMAAPYGRFNDEQKWKNLIKKYNLTGYHLFMSNDFYYNIWKYKGIKNEFMIPHYILVDKEGKIVDINAARPSNADKLYKQIDQLL